ncbi:alpha-(1,3)-fucosyltransferase C-like [Daphnia pulicaria]|uniref:alpha-(1,3)-fucosyltransferase C-like n=1 Tax=Daphnia pulicaria TaxID=35523 RepID=UPI001EEC38CF|nr:alpha-(1,3)-fucosyltransferase C-like [Daphnia pulicaria]
MLDDWRCNHLFRPGNLNLRSTLYVAIFVSFIITVFVLSATDQQAVLQTLLKALPLLENRKNTSIILYWTKFFESSDFEVGLGIEPFGSCIDRVTASSSRNCLTTTDRGLLNDSNAVIFHGRDLHVQDLPLPEWRRPHQIFIFFLLESPIHTDLGLLQQPVFRHYFNRTMTLAFLFEIPMLWKWLSSSSGITLSRSLISLFGINERDNQWESLVRRLSEFISVDIYGKCANGKHSCPNKSECDQMLSRHYRFYLSFENSLCPDYVTEKLYRPLAHDTVPVVYGGADYSDFFPARSYVDGRHFENPEALADHLEKLIAKDTLYSSYFEWKSQYVVDRLPLDGGIVFVNY